jgi:hypothetical protein
VKLSNNDQRVLREIERACQEYDGFMPHGSADWTAIRRLLKAGLIEDSGWSECFGDCDRADRSEPHEGPGFRLRRRRYVWLRRHPHKIRLTVASCLWLRPRAAPFGYVGGKADAASIAQRVFGDAPQET